MKAPTSKGLTMGQLQYYKKISKGSSKKKDWQAHLVLLQLKSWQGRIVELASKPAYKAYKKWFIKNK